MCPLNRTLLACALLLTAGASVVAQDGKKMRKPLPGIGIYDDRCRLCDSLADAYFKKGDTATALYYYRQYLDALPDESDKANNAIKQNWLYKRHQSFYLTDY